MKPLDILSALPKWASATPRDLLASPAWAMPCRLGEARCTMRIGAIRPVDTLDLAIKLESEDHVLGIAVSPAFPELNAVWPSRADVPAPILLALVEKECGQLLQLIENAVRRQLKIDGLKPAPSETPETAPEGQEASVFEVSDPSIPSMTFTLTMSPAVEEALGQLRYIDAAHPSVREATVAAETEYASFAIPEADIASFAPGDALLLPEIGTLKPRAVIEKRLIASENGVETWNDANLPRVCSVSDTEMSVGDILGIAEGSVSALPPPPQENAPLKLVRSGKALAYGHLGRVGDQFAFVIE